MAEAQEVPQQPVLEEEEEEALTFNLIDELQTVGIGMPDINKMKASGYHTVQHVLAKHPKHLKDIKGFSEAKAEKVLDGCHKLLGTANSFKTAGNLLDERQTSIFKITSGSKEFDSLCGGWESKAITELHGEYRTGKTQLCMTACITAQMASEDGSYRGGKVVYIDTEGAFRPERLEPICDRFNVEYRDALDNVIYARVFNSDQLAKTIEHLAALLSEDRYIRLLVVDSIMATYRCDYIGRGELSERQQQLNQVLANIKRLADCHNIAVILTNQMQSDPGANMSFVPDPKKPVGGHILAHAVHTRIALRKGSGDQRIAKIVQNSSNCEKDATYTLTAGGVADS